MSRSIEDVIKSFALLILDREEDPSDLYYDINYLYDEFGNLHSIIFYVEFADDEADAYFIANVRSLELYSLYFVSERIIKVLTKGFYRLIPPKYAELEETVKEAIALS